jgi:hypothetical protein
MIYLSIDIGWVNLAFIKAKIDDENYVILKILEAFCVDLSSLSHTKIPLKECKLQHSNDAYDKVQHLIQEYKDYFVDVDCVCIERQPLTGLVHIEQLLFGYFRDKAQLISPNAMHKFFKINDFDYEGRKKITTKISLPFLKNFTDWKNRERLHDMGDAFCLLIYALSIRKKNHEKSQNNIKLLHLGKNFNQTGLSVCEFIDQFKFKK